MIDILEGYVWLYLAHIELLFGNYWHFGLKEKITHLIYYSLSILIITLVWVKSTKIKRALSTQAKVFR